MNNIVGAVVFSATAGIPALAVAFTAAQLEQSMVKTEGTKKATVSTPTRSAPVANDPLMAWPSLRHRCPA